MEEQQSSESQSSSSSALPKILGILVIVVLLGVGGYYLVSSQKSSQPSSMNQSPSPMPSQSTMMEDQTTQTPSQTAPSTGPSQAQTTEGMVKTITVTGKNFSFDPGTITVKQGDTVKINFSNVGGMHDFVIDEFNVKTPRIQGGNSAEVEFVANKKGTFEYYCSVGSHRQMGMVGKLIVE